MGIRMQKDPWWIRHRTLGFAVGILLVCIAIPIYIFLVIVETVWNVLTETELETDWGEYDYEIGNNR